MHETSAPVRPSLRRETLEAVRLPAAEAIAGATMRASATSINSPRVMVAPSLQIRCRNRDETQGEGGSPIVQSADRAAHSLDRAVSEAAARLVLIAHRAAGALVAARRDLPASPFG